jgi:hypothetical protein
LTEYSATRQPPRSSTAYTGHRLPQTPRYMHYGAPSSDPPVNAPPLTKGFIICTVSDSGGAARARRPPQRRDLRQRIDSQGWSTHALNRACGPGDGHDDPPNLGAYRAQPSAVSRDQP